MCIRDSIYVEEIEKYGSEQLIALVAHGDIDYAVCDESIAPVSYTHLNMVYGGAGSGKMVMTSSSSPGVSLKPVSYTHLDVYKRQALHHYG